MLLYLLLVDGRFVVVSASYSIDAKLAGRSGIERVSVHTAARVELVGAIKTGSHDRARIAGREVCIV